MNANKKPDIDKAQPAAELAQPASAVPVAAPKKPARRKGRKALMLALPVALAATGGYVWITGGRYVDTDNAYVHQPIVEISADVAGRIDKVDVTANSTIKAGQEVFRVDQAPYKIALERADAALAAARLQVAQLRAAFGMAQTQLKAAETIRDVHQRELARQKALTAHGLASSSALDGVTIAARSAENAVALGQQGVAAAAAALGGDPNIATDDFPAVEAALAQRAAAARDLRKTVFLAPVSGIVSQVDGLNVGRFVSPGIAVASLVRANDTWVEANFKETQLDTLKVGQPADVTIDAYPGLHLTGKVESLSSATGAAFSLIPAQNATGNWVKVVQRLAVRIRISPDKAHPLRDGMSAQVSVDTGKSRLDSLR